MTAPVRVTPRDGWRDGVQFPQIPTGRCCAKCSTPYNCGNPTCGCHETTVLYTPEEATK